MSMSRTSPPMDRIHSQKNASDTFRIPLECPGCGASGSIDWRSLKNGIGCPSCGCQFLIGRNGQVLSQAELPHVRFTCPRCRQAGAVPSLLAARGTKCPGCKLPLTSGPDGRLHPVEKAAEMWRAAEESGHKPSFGDWLAEKCIAPNGKVRAKFAAICGIAIVGGLIVVGTMLRALFDRSPETLAKRFVATCLAADWDTAAQYMDDNAIQRTEFARWRMQHFSSILDKYRPAGDRVRVDIRVLESGADARIMMVSMTSKFFGTRSHVQRWRSTDGEWLFDAHETLVAQNGRRIARKRPANLARDE